MDDWRLKGAKDYWFNKTLYKIVFPAFWEVSYKNKNAFYKKVEQDAKKFVRTMHRGHEFLEGEKIQHFWHEHCNFCWEKALTDTLCTFYCTDDMQYWVCEKCFYDFKERFNWQEKDMKELL